MMMVRPQPQPKAVSAMEANATFNKINATRRVWDLWRGSIRDYHRLKHDDGNDIAAEQAPTIIGMQE